MRAERQDMGEHVRVAAAFGLIKGVIVAVVLASLDVAFLKSLAVAAVSGLIGAVGAIVAAYIAVRSQHETRAEIKDIKGSLGLTKRAGDAQPPSAQQESNGA